jgi:hypothetical protein
MKPNAGIIIGVAMGIIGMSAAIFMSMANMSFGGPGRYLSGFVLLIIALMVYVIYRFLIKPMMKTARLMKHGVSTTAIIKQVKDTGVSINRNPLVKLVLEVRNSIGRRYEATTSVVVSRINPVTYRPGMEIAVKVDPQNEQSLIVDLNPTTVNTAGTTGATVNDTTLQQELDVLKQLHDIILLSAEPARAIVKSYAVLAAVAGGNNLLVQLEAEVLPATAAAFSATFKAVLPAADLQTYQPGSEIKVKYDRYDTSRVMVNNI